MWSGTFWNGRYAIHSKEILPKIPLIFPCTGDGCIDYNSTQSAFGKKLKIFVRQWVLIFVVMVFTHSDAFVEYY